MRHHLAVAVVVSGLLIICGCASDPPRSGAQNLWQQGDSFESPGTTRDLKSVQKMNEREQAYFH